MGIKKPKYIVYPWCNHSDLIINKFSDFSTVQKWENRVHVIANKQQYYNTQHEHSKRKQKKCTQISVLYILLQYQNSYLFHVLKW